MGLGVPVKGNTQDSVGSDSEAEPPVIGINERLGETIPLDLPFKDESGNAVALKDLVTKPTILALVYYKCTGICSPLLGSIAALVNRLDADYRVIAVSFDETDTPEIAREKKTNFFKTFNRPVSDDLWRFLTGDAEAIRQLTRSVGFGFKREGKEFIHTASLIVLSPTGKIIRYLYGSNYASANPETGLRFLPFDVKLALVEASEGRVGPAVGRILQYCFSYDPKGRRYTLEVTRVVGAAVTLAGIGFFAYLVIRRRKT